MKLLALDFETAFGSDYTLSKMSTEAYVRDPRFKAHMVGIKFPDRPAVTFLPSVLAENEELRRTIETSAVLCHHAQFDGLILAHHFGLRPAFWLDSLSMARLTLRGLKSHALGALAKHFCLVEKSVPYHLFKGVRDLPADLYAQVAAGCAHDVELTADIFRRLLPYVPRDELRIIDLTVRFFTEPVLRLDRPRMQAFHAKIVAEKQSLLLNVGALLGAATVEETEAKLQSSAQFAQGLKAIGYECPMKWSDKATSVCPSCKGDKIDAETGDTAAMECGQCAGMGKLAGGYIPAIAKNDDGMKALLEHDDRRVQALAAARLGVKSTIDETRSQSLLATDTRGPLPVYLNYAGAQATLRWSGGDRLNWQNFRRGGEIRKSILAPEGQLLVIGDLSQIEYRLLCYVAGQTDKLDALVAGRDLYCEFASQLYGETVTKDDKQRRGVGKQGTLQCGYGAGADSIIRTAASGAYGPPVRMGYGDGLAVRDLYRALHPAVCERGGFWTACETMLGVLASGKASTYRFLEIEDHQIWLPNGTSLDYQGLAWDSESQEWRLPTRQGWTRLWGSKLTADIIQALARVVIAAALLQVAARMRVVVTVHDELVGVKAISEAAAALAFMLDVLRTPPAWAPDIPLEAEGQVSERYDK